MLQTRQLFRCRVFLMRIRMIPPPDGRLPAQDRIRRMRQPLPAKNLLVFRRHMKYNPHVRVFFTRFSRFRTGCARSVWRMPDSPPSSNENRLRIMLSDQNHQKEVIPC